MPKCAKFLKDLLTKKKKLGDVSTTKLSEECWAILQNKFPRKLKSSGNFIIPCVIRDAIEENDLANIGTSINIIPYKIFMNLGLGKPTPTMMIIQLPDRLICHSRGMVEDILVKLDKFIFPVNFFYSWYWWRVGTTFDLGPSISCNIQSSNWFEWWTNGVESWWKESCLQTSPVHKTLI